MNTSVETVRIVRATREHLPRVVELMRGLAEFENLLDQFQVTQELLERHLLGSEPAAELLVGSIDNRIQGYALFFYNFSTFLGRPGVYLEDVYVDPDVRSRGLGSALLVEVIRIARERGCQRCDWIVLNWNERAKQLYESLGAKIFDDWRLCRMDAKAMDELLESDL